MNSPSTTVPPTNTSLLFRLGLGVGLGLCVGLWVAHAWSILKYPIGNDAGIFQYHGWALTLGEIPYRDSWEFNSPGIILLHWTWGKLAGFSDQAFLWLVIGLSSLAMWWPHWRSTRHWSASTQFFAIATGLWSYTLITPWDRGQREFFQGVLLLVALAALAQAIQTVRRHKQRMLIMIGGAAIGTMVTLKITIVLMLIPVIGLGLLSLRRWVYSQWRPLLSFTLWLSAGVSIPIGGVLIWMMGIDALDSFMTTQWEYLPIHRSQIKVPIALAMSSRLPWIVLTLGILMLAMAWFRRARKPLSLTFLGAVLIGTVGLYVFQGKGWTYHLHIVIPIMGVCAGMLLHGMQHARRSWLCIGLGLVFLWFALQNTVYDHSTGLNRAKQVGLHWNYPAHQRVAAVLQQGETTDRVVVNNDEQQLLYMAQRRSATRCMYGFLCSEAHENPTLSQWGQERALELKENPAQWVVWNDFPYRSDLDQLPLNPQMGRWIQNQCQLHSIVVPYRIWRCQTASHSTH